MNRLILIRHAQSDHHVQGLTGGWTNTPLTLLGHEQASAVAKRCRHHLADEPSLALFSSDLSRAAQTAHYIAAELELECRLHSDLRELNNGRAAGLTLDAAKQIECPMTTPTIDWIPYPEAESWRMMTNRIFAALERINSCCPTTAIIVTHGNAGIVVIQWWLRLGEQERQGISFELDPASLSELAMNAWQERTIVRLNDTCHVRHLAVG